MIVESKSVTYVYKKIPSNFEFYKYFHEGTNFSEYMTKYIAHFNRCA